MKKRNLYLIPILLIIALPAISQTTVVSYDFDTSDEGWTVSANTNGDWLRGDELFGQGADGEYWYTSPSSYNDNAELVIQSPVIDLTGQTSIMLFMDLRYSTEIAWDGFQIEYSTNGGGAWTDLGAVGDGLNWYNDTDVDAIANGADGWSGEITSWQTSQIVLPGALENIANARFRVRFETDGSIQAEGVAFDNFILIAGGSEILVEGNSIEIVSGDNTPSIDDDTDFSSANATGETVAQTYTITNRLAGTLTLTGGTPVTISGTHASDFTVTTQPVSTSLAAFASTTFTITFDPSASGAREATVSIANNDADENPYTFDVKGYGIADLINHDFDASDHSWTVATSTNGNWARGTGILSTGADGSYWHTTPTGGYNDDADVIIQSPVIDLTGETNMTLSVDIRYDTEDAWDGFIIQYSSNGGGAWSDLGTVGAGTNWYNDTDVDAFSNGQDGWSNDNGAWQTATINLPAALEDNSNTRFRVWFASDGSVTEVGVAFDNFRIYSEVPDMQISGNGVEIMDGDNSPNNLDETDFRNVDVTAGLKTKTFTITNRDAGTLTLTGGTPVTITGSSDFTVSSQPAVSSLNNGESTTFSIQFNPSSASVETATVSIASNDPDEDPYTFSVQGTGDNAIILHDFETSDSWTVTANTNGDWSRGTGILSTGADGNYWHITAYNSDAELVVQSPVIDLTGESNMTLYMDVRYDTEAAWDGYQVEYSSDGGTNWDVLGVFGEGINWYNDSDVDGISGNSDGWSGDNANWQTAEIDIPTSLEGVSSARFRVRFETDGSVTDVGVAFDNFIIFGDVTPLPVELLSFSGYIVENEVMLDWSTATEINNDFFDVQHSEDGVNFETIGTVQGNGTTNEVQGYNFVDHSPSLGANYYRLRQVDFDGTQEYHQIIKVDNDFVRSGMDAYIYPNPVHQDNLNLRVSSGDNHTPVSVEIVDQNGRSYYQQSFDGSLTIDQRITIPGKITSGLYFLITKQGSNVSKKKLIVR